MRWALTLVFLLPAAVRAQYKDELLRLEQALNDGDWNARIKAVNRLGELGPPALPALRKALFDADWQVRLGSVHWLAKSDPEAGERLQDLLSKEPCPLVRMTAVNALGALGLAPSSGPPEETAAGCGPGKAIAVLESTRQDSSGCRYMRYKTSGKSPCPKGTIARGVGPPPESTEFLKGDPPSSGVALCCPLEASSALPASEPEEVECRLIPVECPAGWSEMEGKDELNWSGKDPRYKRNSRLQEDELPWIHCCRQRAAAAQAGGAALEKPPPAKLPKSPAPPPRGAARGIRLAQIDALLEGSPQNLPRPRGAPRGDGRVSAPAAVMPDAGQGRFDSSDPLPGLLRMLSDKSARRRSRAAEALGNLGPRGLPALGPLKRILLEDESPRARSSAALALGNLTRGADSAVSELKRALKDGHIDVRYGAAQALGRIGTPAARDAFDSYTRGAARGYIFQ